MIDYVISFFIVVGCLWLSHEIGIRINRKSFPRLTKKGELGVVAHIISGIIAFGFILIFLMAVVLLKIYLFG